MNWYLIHTKPRQEKSAELNLRQQGYECYLPLLATEKLIQGNVTVIDEALFPRYLFIRLDKGSTSKSWSPIRSTKGVSRLVTFGIEPARVDDSLVDMLRVQGSIQKQPQRLFSPGERVIVIDGAFAGLEAVYHMNDGESRVMVLIELLSKQVRMSLTPASLRKTIDTA